MITPYSNINEVPLHHRTLRGYKLTLEQINNLRETAENAPEPFAISFDKAREDFKKNHHCENGWWVLNGGAE